MNRQTRDFAKNIWNIGAFKDVTKSPEGKGFRLKLHEKNPDAPFSPFYVDLRLLQSDLATKESAVRVFVDMIAQLKHGAERLGAIPEAIVAVVSSVSDRLGIPMITPRQPKSHGSGAKIDGIFRAGQTVALFDDVITGADSKLSAAETVRSAGLVVNDVLVLVDREQGGRQLLAEKDLTLHAAATITELLDYYRGERYMGEDVYAQIQEYRGVVAK